MTAGAVAAPIIELRGVNKWYGDFHVLKNINLEVAKASGSWSAARRVQGNRP
jgi:ABC-type transporter Mla maintaining outer membrane lipid asymmetry ATPase subunit MlaF